MIHYAAETCEQKDIFIFEFSDSSRNYSKKPLWVPLTKTKNLVRKLFKKTIKVLEEKNDKDIGIYLNAYLYLVSLQVLK